jgi:hypothetical protein
MRREPSTCGSTWTAAASADVVDGLVLACVGCAPRVAGLRADREVLGLLGDAEVADALGRAVAAAGGDVTRGKVVDAFAAASAYRAPQRAMTCALLAVRCVALRASLAGKERELQVIDACAQPTAYAVWMAVNMPRPMRDGAFRVAMREAYGLPVLSPTALFCQTVAGKEGKVCPLRGLKAKDYEDHAALYPRAADQHALTCKCGGQQIHTHDAVCEAFAGVCVRWGLSVRTEGMRWLRGQMRMDVEVPLTGEAGALPLMIDFTRKYGAGQTDLRRAEEAKEVKYRTAFTRPVTMRGAAFNEFGQLGPRAREVVDRAVALGVRTTGSHHHDLRTEMFAEIGVAIRYGNAAAYAHFAELNRDIYGHAPTKRELAARGLERAGGPLGVLSGGRKKRDRKRRSGVAMPPPGGEGGMECAAANVTGGAPREGAAPELDVSGALEGCATVTRATA